MTKSNYLICYDIKDIKTLSAIHRYLSKVAFSIQYSVFYLYADVMKLNEVCDKINCMISDQEDVRIYPIPSWSSVEYIGISHLISEFKNGLNDYIFLTD